MYVCMKQTIKADYNLLFFTRTNAITLSLYIKNQYGSDLLLSPLSATHLSYKRHMVGPAPCPSRDTQFVRKSNQI